MQFKELTNQEFYNFTNNYNIKNIYQTIEYGFTMNSQNYETIFLGLIDNNNIIAATLILINIENGFKYAYAPKGFLLDYNNEFILKEFTKNIKEYLNKKGVMGIKLNPTIIKSIYDFDNQSADRNYESDKIFNTLKENGYYHLGYNNFFEALTPRFEAIIDINNNLNKLFKNVKKNYRTKIRSAINNGIKVYRGNDEIIDIIYPLLKEKYKKDINYFKDFYYHFSKTNKIDIYYTKLDTNEYLRKIQTTLASYDKQSNELNNAIIKKNTKKLINKKINIDKYLNKYQNELIKATNYLRQYPDGIITSCIITVKNNDEVYLLFDGFDKKFKYLNSKHLLLWQLIEIYNKQGFKKFNLGGISNMIVDDEKYYGLNEFKLNFGAKMYEYLGDFELITNKRNYNLYRNYVPLKLLIQNKLKNTK